VTRDISGPAATDITTEITNTTTVQALPAFQTGLPCLILKRKPRRRVPAWENAINVRRKYV
jgi:hypothetical protein